MVLILSVLFCFFPIIICPLLGLGIIFSSKFKKIYSLLFALSLALIAYIWVPSDTYDLFRWHVEMQSLAFYNFQHFISYGFSQFEFLNYLIKYLISLTGDLNLVQFFVTFIGYYCIFWMISDYSKRKNIGKFSLFITLIFTCLSLYYIDFISGLWFYFAVIIFSLGIYCDYIIKTKFIHYILYVISIFLHMSTVYLLFLLIYNKLFKRKSLFFKLLIIILIFLLPGIIIPFLYNKFDIDFISKIYKLYNSYFVNGVQFAQLHNGNNLLLALCRIVPYIIIIYSFKLNLKKDNYKYYHFLIFTIVSVLLLIISATVFIRFVYFIQLIFIPLLLDFFNENKITYNKLIVLVIILIVSICLIYKQYVSIKQSNLIHNIEDNITNNIFSFRNGA